MMTGYRVKRSRPKHAEPARLASLFVVTSKLGARVMERKSLSSVELTKLPYGALFHGVPTPPWVRRLGGGYCVAMSIREVL